MKPNKTLIACTPWLMAALGWLVAFVDQAQMVGESGKGQGFLIFDAAVAIWTAWELSKAYVRGTPTFLRDQ